MLSFLPFLLSYLFTFSPFHLYIVSPLIDEGSHIGRPLGGEVHLDTRRGMNETQGTGMEHLTGTELKAVLDVGLATGGALTTKDLRSTITLIAEQRMADVLHVGSDLMGAPRLEDTLHQCDVTIAFKHLIMGDGRLSYLRIRREHLHPQPIFRITSDITFYPSLVLYKVSPY